MEALRWLAVLLPLLLALPASADFYKYVDENGTIRFTDDITLVPPEQRKKLKIYEEAEPPAPAPAPAAEEGEQPPEEAAGQAPADALGVTEDQLRAMEEQLRAMKEQLDEKNAALAEEYNALTEERKALESRRGKFRTKGQVKQYEEAIRRLNEKSAAYEQKRKRFEEEVRAYNQTNKAFFEAARQSAGQQ